MYVFSRFLYIWTRPVNVFTWTKLWLIVYLDVYGICTVYSVVVYLESVCES